MVVVMDRKPDQDWVDVVEAIEMTVLCQEFHCLPSAGGLLDQDSYRVWQMELVTAAQTEREKLERKRLEAQSKH
jgi:hypothetical protein